MTSRWISLDSPFTVLQICTVGLEVLTEHEVIFPGLLVGELLPGAHRVEVVQDHGLPTPESKHIKNRDAKQSLPDLNPGFPYIKNRKMAQRV